MRRRGIAHTDTVSRPPPGADVQLRETFTLLKEKTDLMRRRVLAVEGATAAAMAMHGGLIEGSRKLTQPSDVLWRALPRISRSHAHCPQCQLLLQAFPRATKLLLTCTNCGFVAKPIEARQKRAALTR
jgi:hypothetical protein